MSNDGRMGRGGGGRRGGRRNPNKPNNRVPKPAPIQPVILRSSNPSIPPSHSHQISSAPASPPTTPSMSTPAPTTTSQSFSTSQINIAPTPTPIQPVPITPVVMKPGRQTNPPPSEPKTPRNSSFKMITDNFQFQGDPASKIFTDNKTFLVVGVLGGQGVGKSTVLSMLHSGVDKWKAETESVPFPVQSREDQLLCQHCTSGVDVAITKERIILLDTQPIFSASCLIQLLKTDSLPSECVSHEHLHEIQCLQLAVFLLSVCHVVLVVQEGSAIDWKLWHFLQTVTMLKTRFPDPSELGAAGTQASNTITQKQRLRNQLDKIKSTLDPNDLYQPDQEYYPDLVFVFNKSPSDMMKYSSVRALNKTLNLFFEHHPFNDTPFLLPDLITKGTDEENELGNGDEDEETMFMLEKKFFDRRYDPLEPENDKPISALGLFGEGDDGEFAILDGGFGEEGYGEELEGSGTIYKADHKNPEANPEDVEFRGTVASSLSPRKVQSIDSKASASPGDKYYDDYDAEEDYPNNEQDTPQKTASFSFKSKNYVKGKSTTTPNPSHSEKHINFALLPVNFESHQFNKTLDKDLFLTDSYQVASDSLKSKILSLLPNSYQEQEKRGTAKNTTTPKHTVPQFTKPVSEKEWLRNSGKLWEIIKRSPILFDYNKSLQSTNYKSSYHE